MNNVECNYISIQVKDSINNTLETGLLVGLKKIIISNIEEYFLILMTNKNTIKLFNIIDYTIISADVNVNSLECKLNFLDINNESILSIEDIIKHMTNLNGTITDDLINIDLYKNYPNLGIQYLEKSTKTYTQQNVPSVFIIKRQLPLLTKKKFLILHNKAHNANSN